MLQTFGLSLLDNLHDRVGEEERLRVVSPVVV
jgi:hypothetical protein